ncbi:MAG: GNAT family N-acetyltransferase [Oscillospiraceae bacterium]|jgi:aminoglycoside 6'-N-acetyltransferase I|nr:GNAT family N-acetyltransferase [Oscillospiraceae bacterium]
MTQYDAQDITLTIRRATADDLAVVTDILAKLYGEQRYDELLEDNRHILSDDTQVIFLAFAGEVGNEANSKSIGAVHTSIRREYVEGRFDDAPIGYLEGIFVEGEYRKRGAARALAQASEDWATARGCHAMASDCALDNTDSLKFHLSVGFGEANRNIHFIKRLGD